ncbi:uncharacterized protein LOC126554295 [Aphis gossypii]|uniref:uncharacterized protein LOC126554295 n=1 Tax=Aphis gossypii TaxID=80765 RepID=UPI00215970B4|nr:uncharacterized protein LOC126554295 [Aphis gossypii]
MDTTFDYSRKEQLSLVVRYIKDLNVYERVIAVHEVTSTTGQNLLEVFTKICLELDLNWKKYLVGQAYDGASNMRGAYNGLQALIKKHNSSALYVWCWAHRLNLIITDAVNSCTDSVKLFGILETIYDFICSSKNIVSLFEKHQKMLYPGKSIRRPKRVETTRWMSHSYALNNILSTYHALLETLEELMKPGKLVIEKKLVKPRRYAEESIEEPIIDPVKTFKIKTFLPIIDVTITQISDRFSERYLKREYLQFSHEYWNFECIKKLPENFYNSSDYLLSDIENSSDSEDEEQENKTKNSVFENVRTLKISLTLPTSSASPERIFSKLKLVKNKLRSTMSAERLDGLMLIACETDIHIDEDKVFDNFANSSTYLKNQLI